MKVITVKLEDDFFKEMKIKLLNNDKTIQDYVVELISSDLTKERKKL